MAKHHDPMQTRLVDDGLSGNQACFDISHTPFATELSGYQRHPGKLRRTGVKGHAKGLSPAIQLVLADVRSGLGQIAHGHLHGADVDLAGGRDIERIMPAARGLQ